jgi:hypothetical protein
MRHLAAAAALLLVGGAAQANTPDVPQPPDVADGDVMVGVGVICNTGQQAEHYVRLRADGAQLMPAVDAVNEEAHEPRACGMAAVVFRRDKTLDTQRLNGKLIEIVRINVMAGYDGERWAPVPPMVQYAVMEADGLEI